MFGDFDLEEGVVGVIEFFQAEFESAFIALSNLSLFIVHLNWFFRFVFLWVLFSFFLFFVLGHFLIHLSSGFFCVWSFLLSFLFGCHKLLHFLSLFFIMVLLPEL